MDLQEAVEKNLKALEEHDATSHTMGCLLAHHCDLSYCRDKKYNHNAKESEKGWCCVFYESHCRASIEAWERGISKDF